MNSQHIAISVKGIGKRYTLNRTRPQSFREAITSSARNVLTTAKGKVADPQGPKDFWALRDISFDILAGQSVGIIGANGSGKSTLLKIISRIVRPTEGMAEIRGRVGALLEVGTGFHPDLSGRDNVFLNGAIIGMTGADIRRQFDAIVDFAGIEGFLDTPIKRYSSGMVMRLAFAVAAHLEPDVLIVDEVLAVGDAEFQRKSLNKISDVATNGCTVFFVSHNLGFVQQLCSRALMLEKGRLVDDGPPSAVVAAYLEKNSAHASPQCWQELPQPTGNHVARFSAIRYSNPAKAHALPQSCGPIRFEVRVASTEAFRAALAVDIYDEMGNRLINLDPWKEANQLADIPVGESVWMFDVESVYLTGGNYVIGLWLATAAQKGIDHRLTAMRFTLLGHDNLVPDGSAPAQIDGLVARRFSMQQALP